MTAIFIMDGKWKYEPTLFLAKNKNEDSDLGWTADLKMNFDKLDGSCRRAFFDGSLRYRVINQRSQNSRKA